MADRVRDLLGAPTTQSAARVRWDPGRRGAAAMAAAVVIAIAVTVWWLLSSGPKPVRVGAIESTTAAGPTPTGSSLPVPPESVQSPGVVGDGSPGTSTVAITAPAGVRSAMPSVVVDVAGKVRHPGIYRLSAGSRIYDAIEAAGGARAGVDLVSLNLAAPLQDGQQVVVGRAGTTAAALPGAAAGTGPALRSNSGGPPAPVDLNTASLDQLDTLPGVGPVLAQHIVDWRTQHGQFTSTAQLNDVSGIGEVKFAELRDLVSV